MGLGTHSTSRHAFRWSSGLVVAAGLAFAGAAAHAQADIEWVTIGDVNNPAYDDPFGGLVDGRGSVGYEYRIGKYEVTTMQWMEFVNTFSTQSDDMALFGRPFHWGATEDLEYGGPGIRWVLNDRIDHAEWVPVHGLSWRQGAMFCNWLHNDKSSELSAIEDGAYDTSTFYRNGDGSYADQQTRQPDARFWIPSLDEWQKAAHYDPNKGGDGVGGWWDFPDGSDSPLVVGFPGEGETSASLQDAGRDIPLGAYEDVQSPWGLFDVSGGTLEWTEEKSLDGRHRWTDGAPTWGSEGFLAVDRIDQMATGIPSDGGLRYGLRIATLVPAPGVMAWVIVVSGIATMRTRRS